MQTYRPQVGDYVLATKYDDGDPCDHFFVGFVSGFTHHNRYLCVDNDGKKQRANGFRRAEVITADEGRQLVEMMPDIGDRPGRSLWWHLGTIRGEDNPADPCDTQDEQIQEVIPHLRDTVARLEQKRERDGLVPLPESVRKAVAELEQAIKETTIP